MQFITSPFACIEHLSARKPATLVFCDGGWVCWGWRQVAGKWLQGARLRGGGGTLKQRLVGLGYAQVCGEAEVWGDGIIPVSCAHLDGEGSRGVFVWGAAEPWVRVGYAARRDCW